MRKKILRRIIVVTQIIIVFTQGFMFRNLVFEKNFAALSVRSMDIVNTKSIAPFIFCCLFSLLRFLEGNVIKIKSSRNLGF